MNKGFTLIPPNRSPYRGAAIVGRQKQISAEMHILYITVMLTLETCTKLLNNGKNKYNNDEVKQIREYLYLMAQLQIESENGLNNHIKD